ncbi:MAG: DUF4097 family beta strand repeat-containing protein [bacterium]
MKNRLIALAALALVATGCLYIYKLEVPANRTWPAADLTAAAFHTLNGTVEVATTADTTVSAAITRRCFGRNRADAEAHIDDIVITDTITGGRLSVVATAPSASARNYGADFEIALPAGLALDLRSSNGRLAVVGARSGITARTSNGAVSLTGTAGTTTINTSNGAVAVAVHSGSITINTSNGAVDCDLVLLEATGHCRIETSNGHVTLRLPADVSARFDLATSNGDVTVGTGFGSVSYTVSERTRKTGTIGSGAAEVAVKSSNGSVTLLPR